MDDPKVPALREGEVMPVLLSISIQSPLEAEDRELLTGLSIMTLAIANHEMAKAHFPGVMPDEEPPQQEEEGEEPPSCDATTDDGMVCISEAGHRGRHRFRKRIDFGGMN